MSISSCLEIQLISASEKIIKGNLILQQMLSIWFPRFYWLEGRNTEFIDKLLAAKI